MIDFQAVRAQMFDNVCQVIGIVAGIIIVDILYGLCRN